MRKNDINAILARPCNKAYSQYGADMGRKNSVEGKPEKLRLQRMRFVDGDYDTGGAYWGNTPGTAMYCAFSPEDTSNEVPIMVFVRALDREDAKARALKYLPGGDSRLTEADGWGFFR